MTNLQVPVFDGKESVNKYAKRVERYTNKMVEDKYDVILEFINAWVGFDYTSLSDFKNVQELLLLKNPKNNRTLVRKYSDIFQNKFEVDLSVGLETDSDEINDRYIIYLLIKMLSIIGYTLAKRESYNKISYTIKKKSH